MTKSDTLSRLSLIQAFWRVGRILGDESGSGTTGTGGSMGPRSSVLTSRDLTSHHATSDAGMLMSKHHQDQLPRLTGRLACPSSPSDWFAARSHRHTLLLRA